MKAGGWGTRHLLNALVGKIDDMELSGIVTRRAGVRPGFDEATTATA